MNEEIEKRLEALAELEEWDAETLTKWEANIETYFSDEILTLDPGFEERFQFLYENKDRAADGFNELYEEAEKLINETSDEKKAEYTEQLQALDEQHRKNTELYESVHQDILKKYSEMEAAAEEKVDAALDAFSYKLRANSMIAANLPQVEALLNSIPDYNLNAAAYNNNFWKDYDGMKRLKDVIPPYAKPELDGHLEDMIACMSEEKKAAYNEQLQALQEKQNKIEEAYKQAYESIQRKYEALDEARDLFDYRFNNIFRGAIDRFRTSDREVDEKKSSDEYKAMRTAINALVEKDGKSKKFDDPDEQKELYRAAYDACSRYVEMKSGKFSKLSHNGSRRLSAASDMMQAITALYPEFEKSTSKTKKTESKKEKEQKQRTSFTELSRKYRDREEKIRMKEAKAAKNQKKSRDL